MPLVQLKAILPPSLVDDQCDRVREVQAAITGTHGDAELPATRDLSENLRRKTTGLGAEDQRIRGAEFRLAIRTATTGLDAEHAHAAQRLKTGAEVRVHPHLCELRVVETGAAHRPARELEPERLHQMQCAAAV